MSGFISKDLYGQILGVMPIPCVDLLVVNSSEEILLIKRKDEPAGNQWWFPGGRVHYGETRLNAAKRKLLEECNLHADSFEEIGTYDVMLEMPGTRTVRHGITTLFKIAIDSVSQLRIDNTAMGADWRKIVEWEKEQLHPFVYEGLSFVKQ